MEKKQLNFNRPLLSVRRGSSSTIVSPEVNKKKIKDSHDLPVVPYYKSDLKTGPIRNPSVIPFQWEQCPGTPKTYKKKSQIQDSFLPQSNYEVLEKDCSPASNSRSYSKFVLSSLELASWEKAISVLEEHEEENKRDLSSSEDDENVTFEQVRDRFSRNDSFFLNCSVSGVSGLDDPHLDPYEGFSDTKTRDFMMGRFLPAAKAMASETPLSRGEEIRSPLRILTEKTVYIDSEQMQEKTISQRKCSNSIFSASGKSNKNVRDDNNNKTQYGSQSSGPPLGMGALRLPTSPSESWLSRAISSKNPYSKPFGGQSFFRASPMNPTQDRMLKISIVKQHMIFRHPEELAPILED